MTQMIGEECAILDRDELRILPNVLGDNEIPLHLISGAIQGIEGVLVGTNRRLFFLPKRVHSVADIKSIPYADIQDVDLSADIMFASITIRTMAGQQKLTDADRYHAEMFAVWVSEYADEVCSRV